jgi:ribose 1,5-bisphosphokinase
MPPIGPGAFIAVVGASGVGKDTLLDAARERSGGFAHFPRRVITRPAGPGEDYQPVSEAEFQAERQRGGFAATWHAHGLDYAIPESADRAIHAGRVVVANVSRGVIGQLAERYERVILVRITVSDEVRAARLHQRGRESPDDITRRLARPDPAPERAADHEIRNDGTVAEAADALLRIITSAIGPDRENHENHDERRLHDHEHH